jgi:hypothetical protein
MHAVIHASRKRSTSMARNLKIIGLALAAVFAMSAVAASAAQATFTWDNGTQTLTVEADGKQTFTTTSGAIQCQGLSGQSAVAGTAATEVTAQNFAYASCIGPFGEPAQVVFGQCDYLFTAGQTLGGKETELTGQAHIKCVNGGQITITGLGGFCQMHVGQQAPGGHVIYRTVAGFPQDVTLEATVTGIVYQGTGLCSSASTGQYAGNVTIKGYKAMPHNNAQQTGVRLH